MKKWNDFVRSILESTEQQLSCPIVEICGYRRVLIEQHQGVLRYETEQIQIKVRYGVISLSGKNLQLCKMCKERLIVTGVIDSVTFLRGSI